jgi:N-acetylmuramoyl-L-alanine amidase
VGDSALRNGRDPFSAFAVLLLFVGVLVLPSSASCLPDGLKLCSDSDGEYASYLLKKGETVWGSVVMHYVMPSMRTSKTAEAILKRSGISDATKLHEGTEIKVPMRYLREEVRPRELKKVKPLRGVVVILDPGHGGIDTGARGRGNVYEDEVVYDIAVRLRNDLIEKTSAEVYMTLRDRTRGYAENHGESFPFDQDEYIRTTPIYYMRNSTIGVHLRWYLTNSIYRMKLREGISSSRIVFISIHADALGSRCRGTMIYYPGRKYVNKGWSDPGPTLRKFREVRECPNVSYSNSERLRSEEVSHRLAQTVVYHLRKKRIKIFSNDPVRDHITRQSEFAPAVLKYNAVPTKILIETVNLQNRTDVSRIRSAWFRDRYAEAILEALLDFFQ